MQLADTIVLVGSIDSQNEYHAKAREYLNLIGTDDQETFIPLANLIEFDLVMKGRNYTNNERRAAFDWLSPLVPEGKIIANSVASLKIAAQLLEEERLSYFDSLISSIALEKEAIVLTTDEAISKVAQTKW